MSSLTTDALPIVAAEEPSIPPEPNPANPPLQCDLVMKGGITSGVVYPAAVMELKDYYRFRSIGGASAGAIAAAFTAAAELGRETGEAQKAAGVADTINCGFPGLQSVREEILDGEKKTLRRLFRAKGFASPLLNLLVQLTTLPGKLAMLLCLPFLLLGNFWISAIVGGAIGAWAGHESAQWLAGVFHGSAAHTITAFTMLGAALGAFAAPVIQIVVTVFWYLPKRNFFGLCQGFIDGDRAVLTTWLHERIERLAGGQTGGGRGRPITFADFAAKDGDRSIELKMMTSNLSHGQPYVFPRPRSEGKLFIFNEEEFARLFPADVVKYLTDYWTKPDRAASSVKLDPHYHFLPAGDDLPVIVATRISLSFPFLLSAIPLYTIKPTAFEGAKRDTVVSIGEEQLQVNWLSDGGISSNFPIHFFDGFLPSRPTFGMNLNYLDKEFKPVGATHIKPDNFSAVRCEASSPAATKGAPTVEDDDTDSEDENEDLSAAAAQALEEVTLPTLWEMKYANPQWKSVGALGGFIGAILATAKDHRDNMQTMLPSYRERTVQIWLRRDEGGLNLAMPQAVVKGIDDKGIKAGLALCPPRPSDDEQTRDRKFSMRHHQWVRLRVLMAAMEPQLRSMHRRFPDRGGYAALLKEQWDAKPKWYKRRDPRWAAKAQARLDLLVMFLDEWKKVDPAFGKDEEATFFCKRPPYPMGVLRVTPDV